MIASPRSPVFAQAKTSGAHQILNTALGEVVATAVSIGAVYVKDHLFPGQTERATQAIAKILGGWRETSPETQQALAAKILDVTAMHLGGLANMVTQFALRRARQPKAEQTPFLYEVGRLLFGRAAGTVMSIGTLALAESQAPDAMRQGEAKIASALDAVGKIVRIEDKHKARLSELLVSSLVQSAGAMVGNAPAQLLFDRIVPCAERG